MIIAQSLGQVDDIQVAADAICMGRSMVPPIPDELIAERLRSGGLSSIIVAAAFTRAQLQCPPAQVSLTPEIPLMPPVAPAKKSIKPYLIAGAGVFAVLGLVLYVTRAK